MDNKELIWVKKEFAVKYNMLESKQNKREEQIKCFEEYMQTISRVSKAEFKLNLENLEEDVAIYTGLMLKVKQAFEKAKNEQLNASYTLWEKFEKEIPSIDKKIKSITDKLEPMQKSINTLNELWGKVNAWNMEKVVETICKMSSLYGTQKEMIDFLVKNFKPKEVKT